MRVKRALWGLLLIMLAGMGAWGIRDALLESPMDAPRNTDEKSVRGAARPESSRPAAVTAPDLERKPSVLEPTVSRPWILDSTAALAGEIVGDVSSVDLAVVVAVHPAGERDAEALEDSRVLPGSPAVATMPLFGRRAFQFDRLPAGLHRVWAIAGKRSLALSEILEFQDPPRPQRAELQSDPRRGLRHLHGEVTDPFGMPASHALILIREDRIQWQLEPLADGTFSTDARKSSRVSLRAVDLNGEWGASEEVSVSPQEDRSVKLMLQRAPRSVAVLSSAGDNALQGAELDIRGEGGATVHGVPEDGGGNGRRFRFARLEPPFTLIARADGHTAVELEVIKSAPQECYEITLLPTTGVSFQVIHNDDRRRAVSDATVTIRRRLVRARFGPMPIDCDPMPFATTRTRADGTAALTGLPAGAEFFVEASAPSGDSARAGPFTPESIPERQILPLEPLGTLRVSITEAGAIPKGTVLLLGSTGRSTEIVDLAAESPIEVRLPRGVWRAELALAIPSGIDTGGEPPAVSGLSSFEILSRETTEWRLDGALLARTAALVTIRGIPEFCELESLSLQARDHENSRRAIVPAAHSTESVRIPVAIPGSYEMRASWRGTSGDLQSLELRQNVELRTGETIVERLLQVSAAALELGALVDSARDVILTHELEAGASLTATYRAGGAARSLRVLRLSGSAQITYSRTDGGAVTIPLRWSGDAPHRIE